MFGCFTEKATRAWHRHKRQKQWHTQKHPRIPFPTAKCSNCSGMVEHWSAKIYRLLCLWNMPKCSKYTTCFQCTGNVQNHFIPVHIPVPVSASLTYMTTLCIRRVFSALPAYSTHFPQPMPKSSPKKDHHINTKIKSAWPRYQRN